ncbi:uncharacterized protein CDV56_104104 [Aspergillus thermomutatus]|uniref:Uncharacterized protein n=1 Tax=Aspergillus thermomutatus TaxID=41047 RepID=A0A397G3Z8_ASPTH|nr:uncharacterized protein CDV56_104104 [Aspergillus thermomutatus]RHZ45752.1 hypothetical protein CDV56_104104 [Aspergillus thermomutatus]
MWYAYRMDIEAFGKRPDMIAPDCLGTVPDGTCYFDEFVDYLQRDGKHLDAGQKTSAGKYFWPDAVVMAKELGTLKSNGADFVPNQDPQKIFKAGTFTNPNPRLSDILELITDRIQAARVKLGDDALSDGLFEARTAMTGVHEARLADNGQGLIDTINDYLRDVKGSSTTVETKTPTALDGSTYLDVDVDKTKAKDPAFAGHWADFQQWLGQQKRTNKTKLGQVRMHWDAAQGVQQVEARVYGASSC